MKPQPRSGDHIQQRGNVWHYWRIIPPDCKRTYGKSVESRSLDTMNRTEAKRLAKAIDLEVDRRIREIREASDPAAIANKIAERVRIKAANYGDGPFRADPRINAYRHIRREVEYAPLTDEGRAKATELAWQKMDENLTKASVAKRLGQEIATLLDGFAPEQMERCRAGILSLIPYQKEGQAAAPTAAAVPAEPATASTAPAVKPFSPWTYTLSQAWDRWVSDGQGKHSPGTVKLAKGHWKAFLLSSKMAVIDPNGEVMPMEMLVQVRRSHLVKWRDSLVDGGEYRPKSINQRIQLVSAILRAGWREAEIPSPDLSKLTVPEPDDSGRRSWTRDEIATALRALEPGSWSAWTYIFGLSSSTRLGEFVAAKVGWWNAKTGFIEVPASATKRKKPHAIPVLGCLREAFERYIAKRPHDGFMFDAPRPADPDVDISKVASQWFQRFSRRFNPKLPTFHELRDTWIEEARHCPTVKREIWEIISGHSAATVSDRYGGEKPHILFNANQDVCKFLIEDPKIRAAMLPLVA